MKALIKALKKMNCKELVKSISKLDTLYDISIDELNKALLKFLKTKYRGKKPDKMKVRENALREPVFREVIFRDGSTITLIANPLKGKPFWKAVKS